MKWTYKCVRFRYESCDFYRFLFVIFFIVQNYVERIIIFIIIQIDGCERVKC